MPIQTATISTLSPPVTSTQCVVVDLLDHADGRVDPGEDLGGRRVDGDPRVHRPAGRGDLAQHERGVVPAGQRLGGNRRPPGVRSAIQSSR